jgi:hypothetical protein
MKVLFEAIPQRVRGGIELRYFEDGNGLSGLRLRSRSVFGSSLVVVGSGSEEPDLDECTPMYNSGRRGLVKPPGTDTSLLNRSCNTLLKPQGACPVRERVLPPMIISLTPCRRCRTSRGRRRQQQDNNEKMRQTGTYLFTTPAEPMNHRALKPYRKRLFRARFRSRIRLSGTLWSHFFRSSGE